jgi:hypothetical protein
VRCDNKFAVLFFNSIQTFLREGGLSKRAPKNLRILSTTLVDSFHARETLHDIYCDDDLCQSASPYLGHYHPTLQKVESLLDYENLVEETRSAAKEHLYPAILYLQS